VLEKSCLMAYLLVNQWCNSIISVIKPIFKENLCFEGIDASGMVRNLQIGSI
jgi:hypothetical protein